ncbi:Retrovirus-related Pol polyprotein from transposon 297 [Vitis vinifera]|uniref:Retrovirus-related Pol polyprotein from transposon 297 n=1 Tax=Vitis vinifera TaxID=29760 RepID=A0A438EFD0_VITVI|nr:Retrovirus-related Pol polyprotein from transposon 297 [Vitis vinifera]
MNRSRASGVYTLPEGLDVQAKFATVMRRLDDLEAKGVQEIEIVNDGVTQLCLICNFTEHGVQSCPTLPAVQDMFTKQVNALRTYNQYSSNSPHSNTYNPGWRNHPNLSWREGNNGQFQQQGNQFQGNQTNGQQGFQPQVITLRNGKEYEGPKLPLCRDIKVGDKTLKILEVLKQVKINIPLLDMIKQLPAYAKFLKDLCTVKRRIKLSKKAFLTEQVSAIIKNKAMVKYKDPGCPCHLSPVWRFIRGKGFVDLGASVNLLLYSIYNQLGLGELKATTITLSLLDRSIKVPRGIVEDVLVQVEIFYYPMDFVVLDTGPLKNGVNSVPIILGRPFLATANALINYRNGLMQLSFGNMTVEMNVFNLCKQPMDHDDVENEEACLIEALVQEHTEKLMEENIDEFFSTIVKEECVQVATEWKEKYTIQSLNSVENDEESKKEEVEISKPELKPLPHGLKYVYLEANEEKPVVISATLTEEQEMKLLKVLKENKRAIGWSISDLKGINPLICTHHIYLEENAKPVRQPQRRLNPLMQDVVRNEVLKLLDAGIIYPISDSSWVSPTQVVPKKSGITVMKNDEGELIPTRLTTGWRVCIDFRKLNAVTKKDHFPLPFLDQVLERVAGHDYYCFLDGYSGYFQIAIALEDQEKTTFTCPFGTMLIGACLLVFVMHRPHFKGVCLVFSVTWCIENDLVLNWEKCHFMATSGVVLGHIISKEGIQVDPAKIELISKLPSPTTVKEDAEFIWTKACQEAFKRLNGSCTRSKEDGKPYVVYYASKTLNDAQKNYTTTEKELLAVVFALDKFRNYLLGTSIVIFTDHSALKYLLNKKDAKARLIRWILLLQEFNIQIKDKQGVENVVADHLSRVKVESHFEEAQINDEFPDDALCAVEKLPCFAQIKLCGDVFQRMNNKTYCECAMKELVEVILLQGRLQQKFYRVDSIGQLCSRIVTLIAKVVHNVNNWGKSTQGIKCLKIIFVLLRSLIVGAWTLWDHSLLLLVISIFLGVDYVSKWVEAVACKSNDHKVVLKFLKENIFSRFGIPRAIISDGGSHFCNKPFSTLLQKYGVRHKVSTPYHPQNGQAELANREIKRILTKVVNTTRKDWSTKLKLEHRAYWAIKKMNFDSDQAGAKRKYDLNELEAYRNESYECLRNAREKHKFYHDKLILRREFKQGEKVLLYDSKLHIFPGKLRSRWNGPYVVKEVFPYGTVTIQNPRTGNEFKVNGQRLKHFIERFETQEENLHFLDGDVQKG